MTVTSSIQDVSYATDGSTVDFPTVFYFLDANEVFVDKIDANGALTSLVFGTDYSVSGAGVESGGAVATNVAYAYGSTLHIYRQVPVTQETEYQQNDPFPAKATEKALDKLTMIAQQVSAVAVNSIRYPLSEYGTDGTLPKKNDRAGKVLAFDSTGQQTLVPLPASVGAGDLKNEVWTDGIDYTAGTSSSVSLSRAYGAKANLGIVVMAGVSQDPASYSLTNGGMTLQFDAVIPLGVSRIWCVGGTTLSLYLPPDGSVGDDQLAWGNILNRNVDAIAALRALDSTVHKRAFVTGYYAAGDGGGGAYYLDQSDTTSADNTGTIIVANDGARWKLRVTNSVSVKQFGATGSGTSGFDDSAAIQRATNWAAAAGKTLFFPAGTYRLRSFVTWPAGTKWLGEPGTHVYLDPAMTLGINIGGLNRGLYNVGAGSLSLEGIVFESVKTGLTQSVSVAVENTVGVRITNCTFRNFGDATHYAQGFIAFQTTDIRLLNSRFYNCSGDGAALASNIVNFNVSGCEFSQNGDWGLALSVGVTQGAVQGCMFTGNVGTAVGADRCTDVAFIGNTMVNNLHGVRVCKFGATPDVNRNITISGNNIVNAGAIGISIEQAGDFNTGANANIAVTGNTITGSGGQGINVNDSTDVAVVGNAVFSTVSEAVLLNAFTAGWETGRITVSGNKIDTCAYGIRQLTGGGTASRSTVVGNDITGASVMATSFPNPALVDYIDGNSSTSYFDLSKTINVPSGSMATTASSGGIALPAQVWQFLPIYVGGALKKIPVYNA
ncbi:MULTISPECIES: right-handed parallel beta-helix repeat-containing protein [Burkholderia]|uniref:Right-handed parallel beta-helix repeat-containing protein n=1 Tax=Burkholderia sola TaxID=2843302 RepID=A0ABV2CAU9_9BURK|nr:right-handed parallel beta-helix repeat-containing protein [Burkholderia sp. CpTa8-5]MBP0608273.1 right-handed parallel beta-helix repeat-containing protein [Burkholderia sp. CpTa8-5]